MKSVLPASCRRSNVVLLEANQMFAYTPYDGARQPFSIGVAPLDSDDWIRPDALLADELAQKEALIAAQRDAVWREEDGTREAQAEVCEALAAFVTRRYPQWFRRDGNALHILPASRSIILDDEAPPLLTASRFVQDDLCLMRRGDDGWRLVAASLCAPSTWSLAEKIGLPMAQIHAPVPGFAGRMGAIIARIFDALQPGQIVERFNWSIYGDNKLNHALSRAAPHEHFPDGEPVLPKAHIRVERQTLRRMPASGDILFTIRIYPEPIAMFAGHPRGPALAAGLRAQLLGLNADQLAYKGLVTAQERLAAALELLAAT